jgi:hypothetical protein
VVMLKSQQGGNAYPQKRTSHGYVVTRRVNIACKLHGANNILASAMKGLRLSIFCGHLPRLLWLLDLVDGIIMSNLLGGLMHKWGNQYACIYLRNPRFCYKSSSPIYTNWIHTMHTMIGVAECTRHYDASSQLPVCSQVDLL